MRSHKPIVLVTRPKADAQKFIECLKTVAGLHEAIISPAFAYECYGVNVPDFDTAIFTSKTGVAFAPAGHGRRAYCVGRATADAAKGAGYNALSADGSANDLVNLILRSHSRGVLSHLRGEISSGDVSGRLQAAGLTCIDTVLYRKVRNGPTERISNLDEVGRQVIVPLFSAETVSIIAQWPTSFAGCHVAAISECVAQAATVLKPAQVLVADRPDMNCVALATARMIA